MHLGWSYNDPSQWWGACVFSYMWPNVWNIFLHGWLKFMVNVGKYSSPMDAMGLENWDVMEYFLGGDMVCWLRTLICLDVQRMYRRCFSESLMLMLIVKIED